MTVRPASLAAAAEIVAEHITARLTARQGCVVGVTGIDGSGKTTFAAHLTTELSARGRATCPVHVDDFHRPRAVRYGTSLTAPEKYLFTSIDFGLLKDVVLRQARSDAVGEVVVPHLDLETDTYLHDGRYRCGGEVIVVVEGVFLFRPEIRPLLDVGIWIDTPADVARDRGIARDAAFLGLEGAMTRYDSKYHAAQLLFAACERTTSAAEIVVRQAVTNEVEVEFRP